MNLKFTISYDGSLYQGSQRQPNKKSVEDRLIEVFKSINIDPKITLSGRTDRDVHATGQVFNIKVPEYWDNLNKLKKVLNHKLPYSIRIKRVSQVEDDFHSRFHAKRRVYRYIVSTKKISPFMAKYITFVEALDEKKVKSAVKIFEGKHNFEYFHKSGSDKENFIKEVYSSKFYKYKDFYIFRFEANSYLRSQIRLMVGFLLKISKGDLNEVDLLAQLNLEKKVFKTPAPANGLYLSKIFY